MNPSDYEDKISLESGINYITSKDVDGTNKEKSIYLKNFKYEESQPYMASFYSPNCQYTLAQKFDSDDIKFDFMDIDNNAKFKKISDINGMSSFFTNEMRTPIDADQKLLVIKCNDANSTEKYEYNKCEVLSTIFGEKEVVQLIEKQPFGRYNTPDITNHYLIDLSSVKEPWFKVHIDFLVVSGDVSINIQNNDPTGEIDAHKYYLSNKIFFSITVDRNEVQNRNLQKNTY
jgi:hypothetical protein